MAGLIPVCVGGSMYLDAANMLKCEGTLEFQATATVLDSPITIADHVELAWLVVGVLIVGAAVGWIKKTLP